MAADGPRDDPPSLEDLHTRLLAGDPFAADEIRRRVLADFVGCVRRKRRQADYGSAEVGAPEALRKHFNHPSRSDPSKSRLRLTGMPAARPRRIRVAEVKVPPNGAGGTTEFHRRVSATHDLCQEGIDARRPASTGVRSVSRA